MGAVRPDRAGQARAPAAGPETGPLRVMLADDSAVVRSLITRILESDPEFKVVASVANGQQAVDIVARHRPDVLVLDLDMPVMDGLTALPKLIQAAPGLKVIVVSTLTRRNADISLRALEAGAAEYVAKPEARAAITADEFRRELLQKVRVLGNASRAERPPAAVPDVARGPAAVGVQPDCPVALRPASAQRPRVLAIGSSTGGPKALFSMLSGLDARFQPPILIAQHMPQTFTTILAEHIMRATGRLCQEGAHGQAVQPGCIYVAPGDHHMTVVELDGRAVIQLDRGPRENFCRPAVDRLLASVAGLYGAGALAVILTGMGRDGLKGCETVIAAGGSVVTQDAATSVVWGMPGAVVAAGLACANLPVQEIGPYVSRLSLGAGR